MPEYKPVYNECKNELCKDGYDPNCIRCHNEIKKLIDKGYLLQTKKDKYNNFQSRRPTTRF